MSYQRVFLFSILFLLSNFQQTFCVEQREYEKDIYKVFDRLKTVGFDDKNIKKIFEKESEGVGVEFRVIFEILKQCYLPMIKAGSLAYVLKKLGVLTHESGHYSVLKKLDANFKPTIHLGSSSSNYTNISFKIGDVYFHKGFWDWNNDNACCISSKDLSKLSADQGNELFLAGGKYQAAFFYTFLALKNCWQKYNKTKDITGSLLNSPVNALFVFDNLLENDKLNLFELITDLIFNCFILDKLVSSLTYAFFPSSVNGDGTRLWVNTTGGDFSRTSAVGNNIRVSINKFFKSVFILRAMQTFIIYFKEHYKDKILKQIQKEKGLIVPEAEEQEYEGLEPELGVAIA